MELNGNGCHKSVHQRDITSSTLPPTKRIKVSAADELEDFDQVFPTILSECLNEGGLNEDKSIGDAITHFLKVCK